MSSSAPKTYKEILEQMVAGIATSTPASELEKGSVFNAYLKMIEGDLHRQKLLFTLQRLDKRFKQYAWESIFKSLSNFP